MNEYEALMSLAQIAVGLAGFAGVAIGFHKKLARIDRFNLRLVIILCIIVTCGCIVPTSILYFQNINESGFWVILSMITFVIIFSGILILGNLTESYSPLDFTFHVTKYVRNRERILARNPLVAWIDCILMIFALFILGTNFSHGQFGPYFLALALGLVVALLTFLISMGLHPPPICSKQQAAAYLEITCEELDELLKNHPSAAAVRTISKRWNLFAPGVRYYKRDLLVLRTQPELSLELTLTESLEYTSATTLLPFQESP